MSTPSDPHSQPYQQPEWPGHQVQPGYGQPSGYEQPYGYQQPADYQQPYGYQQYPAGYGAWPGYQPPAAPPKRPAVLIIAGVIWLVIGLIMLLFGVIMIFANGLPEFERVYADNPDITPELLTGVGIVMTVLAVIVIGLAIAVFSGAMWARVAIAIVGGLLALFGFATVVLPLLALAAIVLMFLPASNEYAKARRRRLV